MPKIFQSGSHVENQTSVNRHINLVFPAKPTSFWENLKPGRRSLRRSCAFHPRIIHLSPHVFGVLQRPHSAKSGRICVLSTGSRRRLTEEGKSYISRIFHAKYYVLILCLYCVKGRREAMRWGAHRLYHGGSSLEAYTPTHPHNHTTTPTPTPLPWKHIHTYISGQLDKSQAGRLLRPCICTALNIAR